MFSESEYPNAESAEATKRTALATDETTQDNLAASAGREDPVAFDEAEPAETIIVVPPVGENGESPEADLPAILPAGGMVASGSAAVERTVTIMQTSAYGAETFAVDQGGEQEDDAPIDKEVVTGPTDEAIAPLVAEEVEKEPAPEATSGGNGEKEPPVEPPTGGDENDNNGEDDDPKKNKKAAAKNPEEQPSGEDISAPESSDEQAKSPASPSKDTKEEALPPRPKRKVADLPSNDQQELARISQTSITEHPVATRDAEEGVESAVELVADGSEEELDIRVLKLVDSELQYMRTTNAQGEAAAWILNVNVPDHLQGFGIGSRLLEDLAARCAAADIRFIESLTVSESGLRSRLRVFGDETTEFYDPNAAHDNHDGWEGRKDVLPLTPAQAVASIKLGRQRANIAWAVDGGSADNGVRMRTDVRKYFAAEAAAESRPEEEK
jgi:GNAT superfamily N-acetyltransferase